MHQFHIGLEHAGIAPCYPQRIGRDVHGSHLQPVQRQADGYAARACAYVQCTLSGLCLLQDEACQFGCLGSRNEHPRLHMEGASEEFTRSQHILHGFAHDDALGNIVEYAEVVCR